MANGKKTYEIVINGIKESIDAVDSLNRQLDSLEKRIEKLSKQNITVNTSGGGNVSALSEEDKLQQQILATEEKIKVARSESYEQLVNAKAELKEMQTIAKASAAGKNNAMGIFDDSTMLGIKEHLKSIKQEMQTMDIGSDAFKKLQNDANDLNNKLKEIEQGYGQFGRNVGNYANGVAEGIQKYKVEVAGATREFNSAKEAARTLSNELLNLPKGAEGAQDLRKALHQVKSDIKDISASSKGMDNLLDTMKSFSALASVGNGLSALFGFDDSAIEQSIQKLVALQNVMQGLEQVSQQMNTGEGIGGWLSKGNDLIDSFTQKLLGASKAQSTLNAETTAGATASKTLTAAETAQATATGAATVATKALSLALKTIGIGLVISLVATLITYWKDIYKWLTDTVPALKNLSVWFDKIRAVAVGVGSAIINYMVQPLATLVKVIQAIIDGNFSEIPKIISEGLKKTFNISKNYQKGYHKETERQQEKHNQKLRAQQKKANEEQLKDEEAKYGRSHKRTQEYYRKQMALVKEGSDEYRELQRKLWEDERLEREENEKRNMLGAKGSSITAQRIDMAKKAEEDLTNMTLELMQEGLSKELAQLRVNNNRKISELKKEYASQKEVLKQLINQQEKLYEKQRTDILTKYNIESEDIIGKNTIKEIENEVDELNRVIDDKLKSRPAFIQPISSIGLKEILSQWPEDEIKNLYEADEKLRKQKIAEATEDYTEYYKHLIDFMRKNYMGTEEMDGFINLYQNGQQEEAFKKAEELWKGEYKEAEKFVLRYGEVFEALQNDETQVLSDSLHARMAGEISYFEEVAEVYEKYTKKRLEKEKEAVNTEMQMRNDAIVREANKIGTQLDDLRKKRDTTTGENELAKIDEEIAALEKRLKGLGDEQYNIVQEYTNKLVELDRKTDTFLKNVTEKTFRNQASNIRDYLTEMDKLENKQPIYNNVGFINVSATGKQYEEIKNTAVQSLRYIEAMRDELAAKFEEGLITPEARSQIESDLNGLEISVNTRLDSVKHKTAELPIELAKQINSYMQLFGQAATQILQSIGEIQDAAFEREMEVLDKYTEELEKQLDKQRELTEKYKDDVNNIEDELSTARGDRRQHLIDQLNAEIAAQRASYAQEKKIEREKEKNEEKKKKLEDENNKRKKKQAITTALINAALAISNAAVNTWPIPAIPMMAAAAAVGAAQIAAVKAAKYADGGVLQGKSHAQGGVKVLGGRAELEGGEYITNKATTAKNVDLLDYINSKRKKIDLDDIIDFYGRKSKVGKTVRSVKAKYADGGYLPTLRNDIDVSDRVVTAMESYANKPTYVQVVDIINKADNVRKVQVMAGLSGES